MGQGSTWLSPEHSEAEAGPSQVQAQAGQPSPSDERPGEATRGSPATSSTGNHNHRWWPPSTPHSAGVPQPSLPLASQGPGPLHTQHPWGAYPATLQRLHQAALLTARVQDLDSEVVGPKLPVAPFLFPQQSPHWTRPAPANAPHPPAWSSPSTHAARGPGQ